LNKKSIIELPELKHVNSLINGAEKLLQCWRSLNVSEKHDFVQNYGRIASLLEVPLRKTAIKALLHFWDPAYKCFSFDEVDMVPTIEE
jgi:hypothetical protein